MYKKIIIFLVTILALILYIHIIKHNLVEKNIVNDGLNNNINKKETKINLTVSDIIKDGNIIVIDNDLSDIILLNVNKEYILNIYKLKYDDKENKFIKDSIIKTYSNKNKDNILNIKVLLSETIPNILIQIKTNNNEIFEYIPSYNGNTGTYEFKKLITKIT